VGERWGILGGLLAGMNCFSDSGAFKVFFLQEYITLLIRAHQYTKHLRLRMGASAALVFEPWDYREKKNPFHKA
jgi:hypothetical protein